MSYKLQNKCINFNVIQNKTIEEINYVNIEGFWLKIYDNVNIFVPIYKLRKT